MGMSTSGSAGLAARFAEVGGLRNVVLVGEGLEFSVFRAESPAYGVVALRVPKEAVYQNVNDPYVEASALLRQEWALLTHLAGSGAPVPEPYELLEIDGQVALLSSYVDDDNSEADPHAVGHALAVLHSVSPPEITTVAQEGLSTPELLGCRIARRWYEARKLVPTLPELTRQPTLIDIARGLGRFPPSLLHLDVRGSNLRVWRGELLAFVDWSNALVGPAAIDLYRIAENEKPDPAFLRGYAEVRPVPQLSMAEELLLRLDAAVMLALVFLSEAPDAQRASRSVRRITELAHRLGQAT